MVYAQWSGGMQRAIVKIVFVNGLVDFGATEVGRGYWYGTRRDNVDFVEEAQKLFQRQISGRGTVVPAAMYTDQRFRPAHAHADPGYRRRLGHLECLRMLNHGKLTGGFNRAHDKFVFVSHSMGAAYAEGMMDILKGQGWVIHAAVHINPFQPIHIKPSEPRSLTIHVQDPGDPVTTIVGAGPMPGAKHIERRSPPISIFDRHKYAMRAPSLWKVLRTRFPEIGL